MLVKICGITRPEDARAAEAAGADAIGMIFVPRSKRYVDVADAHPIAEAVGPFMTRVGVFLDAPLDEVRAAVLRLRLDVVQLHGDEDQAYVAALRPSVRVIKAVRAGPSFPRERLEAFDADAVLLDGAVPGSGKPFAWRDVAPLRGMPRLIVAGGLHPDNVEGAIHALAPYGVDVASGVESSPGIKDPFRMRAFVERAKAAGRQLDAAPPEVRDG